MSTLATEFSSLPLPLASGSRRIVAPQVRSRSERAAAAGAEFPEPVLVLAVSHAALRARLFRLGADAGYQVECPDDASSLLATLERRGPCVVLIDREYGGPDAFKLSGALREAGAAWPTQVVALVARAREVDAIEAMAAGADDCLWLPALDAELVTRLGIIGRALIRQASLRHRLERQRRMATTDELTGVYNRRFLYEQLEREVCRARRYLEPLSVLLLDIDRFKRVNDTLGHAAGDQVLRDCATRVRRGIVRGSDWLARYGGEEFAIVLPQTDGVGAATVAERLRLAVAERPVVVGTQALQVTVSIGVASLEAKQGSGPRSPQSMLDAADRNLYVSKAHGRNRVTASPQGVA